MSSTAAPDYEESRKALEDLSAWFEANQADRNEATTRLQLVDRLFFDCLGWHRDDGVKLEEEEGGEYADYVFSSHKDVLIVEAKREGKSFELPAGVKRQRYAIKSLMRDYPELRKAIRQVAGYCWERGVPYAAVSNGHQLVAFVASRSDGVGPLEGQALVFPSLDNMLEHFHDLWQALSKPGVTANHLYARLVGDTTPELPPKLWASIDGYPGLKERNAFQIDLMNLTELVIEDVVRAPQVEQRFLNECYCTSDALSQYSALSRDILAARYSALFDHQEEGPTTLPVRDRKGTSSDFLAESVSRRPILLLGDVGVGKTSFLRHLILIDAKEVLGNSLTLYVNLGVKGTMDHDLKNFVIREMERQLFDKHEIYIHDAKFARSVYELEMKLFEREIYVDINSLDKTELDARREEFIREKRSDRVEHLRRSIEHLSKARKRQVVIFLDNTDQRESKDQDQAFLIAQEFAANWSAAVYLPIRPSTFYFSKRHGALSGYHAKAFTISPPRVDLVIKRRLRFTKRFTSGEIPLELGNGMHFEGKLTHLDSLIDVFLESLDENRELLEILDNVSDGNIRLALDLVKQFFGSGHVNTKKICEKAETPDGYTIPTHEFLRAVIFGNTAYYDADTSPVANLFDLKWNDPKEHFLLPLLIGNIAILGVDSNKKGFVESKHVYQRIQGYGFNPDQLDHAIGRALLKNLIEAPARKVSKPGQDAPRFLRATSFGYYHVKKLIRLFSYLDAIAIDVPILDTKYRQSIRDVDQERLHKRIDRVMLLKSYLDDCWKSLPERLIGFDWSEVARDLMVNIEKVRESNERQNRRRTPFESWE